MTGWGLTGLLLGGLFLLDALRLRGKLRALPVLAASAPAGGDSWALLVAPGAALTPETRAEAAAFADAEGLQLLDLVPARWRTRQLLSFLQLVDPAAYRNDRLAGGRSAGEAILVRRSLLARAGLREGPALDPVGFARAARALKAHAPDGCGFAIAPGLSAAPAPGGRVRFLLLREFALDFTPSVLAGQLGLWGLVAMAAWRGGAWGWAGLASLHLQPWIALAGGRVRLPDLPQNGLFALALQLSDWIGVVASARPDEERRAMVAAARPAALSVAAGAARFFEPRREDCYVCGSRRLSAVIRLPDRLQHKPGTFTLERCTDCGHLFQNPRLTAEGLSFYYRDFYDGLGERWLDALFGLARRSYLGRARELSGLAPRRWLDVGTGYGHFCLVAREVWPDTRFEGLDAGASVEEGARRGWLDEAHRGFLPDLAPSLRGRFDAISLSHCLEHARDPRAEIAAAHAALAPGGALLIEVPDPECRLRPLLRSLWLPYFQPQHQHLLSVANLRRLLAEAGFQVERVRRDEVHTGADFFFAAYLALDAIAPRADLPWLSPPRRGQPLGRAAVFAAGGPLLLAGVLADGLVRPFLAVPRLSNAYRILARRA